VDELRAGVVAEVQKVVVGYDDVVQKIQIGRASCRERV